MLYYFHYLCQSAYSVNADFLKMSSDAEILDMESSEWSCVLDNKSSLVWEVKSENEGITVRSKYLHLV